MSSRIGLLVDNVLNATNQAWSVGLDPLLTAKNATTRRVGESASGAAGPVFWGGFQVQLANTATDNTHLDITISTGAAAGTYDVTLNTNDYRADALASHVTTRMIAVTGEPTLLCQYRTSDGIFLIVCAEQFTILGATGANASASILNEIGHPATDNVAALGGGFYQVQGSVRWGTTIAIRWDVTDADRGAAIAHLASDPAEGAPAADFDDARLYLANANWGPSRSHWDVAVGAGNAEVMELSPAGVRHDQNPVHLATRTTGTARTVAFFIWRFFDSAKEHHVGFVGLMKVLTSATRQISQIQRHGLTSASGRLHLDNYPAARRQQVALEVRADDWLWSTDYATVVYPLELIGTSGLVGVAVNYSEIADATLDAEDEADRGFLFLGSLAEEPERGYGSVSDSRASASLKFVQAV